MQEINVMWENKLTCKSRERDFKVFACCKLKSNSEIRNLSIAYGNQHSLFRILQKNQNKEHKVELLPSDV